MMQVCRTGTGMGGGGMMGSTGGGSMGLQKQPSVTQLGPPMGAPTSAPYLTPPAQTMPGRQQPSGPMPMYQSSPAGGSSPMMPPVGMAQRTMPPGPPGMMAQRGGPIPGGPGGRMGPP
ncbi:hypothetical protein TELCIR_21942, partial [Teladorsagia circumcincta]